MAGKFKMNELKAMHARLGEMIDEFDASCAPTTDTDLVNATPEARKNLVNAERGGANPTVDSAPAREVPIHTAFPEWNRLGGSLAGGNR